MKPSSPNPTAQNLQGNQTIQLNSRYFKLQKDGCHPRNLKIDLKPKLDFTNAPAQNSGSLLQCVAGCCRVMQFVAGSMSRLCARHLFCPRSLPSFIISQNHQPKEWRHRDTSACQMCVTWRIHIHDMTHLTSMWGLIYLFVARQMLLLHVKFCWCCTPHAKTHHTTHHPAHTKRNVFICIYTYIDINIYIKYI